MSSVITEVMVITLMSTVGNCLFKIGTDGFGDVVFQSMLTKEFLTKFITTRFGWLIIISMAINLGARFLFMIPMSKERFGIVLSISAPIGLVLTVIVGYFIFHEVYTIKEIVGIILSTIAIWLMR